METKTADETGIRAENEFRPADHVVEAICEQLDASERQIVERVDDAVGLDALDRILENEAASVSFPVANVLVTVEDGGAFVVTEPR